ncbi:guanylyl cyclase 1-like isoform X2 [Arachis stenosperma]|uniref:guanylyl cyclase 1-like isoform X2 n=1 Tax=Arachis stenosperma TaxID=217475 RepID=UPI0025AC043E|nr:guanylyl cyclase 1-like isoform X2 [Arachis stenosperma]
MVLKTIGVNDRDIQALAELCCTNSVWTVDLAYLLQKFFVAFSYFTVTFGANPNFSVESFYKEELPDNLFRLDMLFQKAVESGIDIQCRSISGREISIPILSGKYIAIALVDQSKLRYRFLLICSVLFWLQYLIDDSFSTLTYSTFLPTFYIVPVVNQVYSFDTILFRRNLSLQLHYNTFFVHNFFLDHVIILTGKVQFNLHLESFCFSHVLQDDVHVPEVSSNNPGYTGDDYWPT